MALILFESRVDMRNVATPSLTGGVVVAYDTDGVLKQKDHSGVITPIAGSSSPGSLQKTLAIGNNTGTYSISLGVNTKILGSGQSYLKLDSGIELSYDEAINSYLRIYRDSTTLANNQVRVILDNSYVQLQYSTSDLSKISSKNYNITLDGNKVLEFTTEASGKGEKDKISALISSKNSTLVAGVYNTVVLGGQDITGATSNSVYVPNIYVKDGGFIKGTTGSGSINFNSSNDIILSNTSSVIGIVSSKSSTSFSQNGIFVKDSATASSSPNFDTGITYVSTKNSTATASVKNSVIIGGKGLTASKDNTVYLGNYVDINNAYRLPSINGSTGQVLKTNISGTTSWEDSAGMSYSFTAASFSTLRSFKPNSTYIILNADSSLYGDIFSPGNLLAGTEIYLTTNASSILNETGIGKFYNPKYESYSIWDSNGSYEVGETVIWGGKVWENKTGNTGSASNIFTLNSSDWRLLIADDTGQYYNISYDEIKYGLTGSVVVNKIIYRNEKNSNIVSVNISTINNLSSDGNFNPIKAFQWGNLYDGSIGIGRQNITNSYNENINFTGLYQIDMTLTNYSKQYDYKFASDAFQRNIVMSNKSWNRNNSIITKSESNLTFVPNKHLFGNDFLVSETLSNVNIKGTLNFTLPATASKAFNANGEAVYYGGTRGVLTVGYLYANIDGEWQLANSVTNYKYQLAIAMGPTPSIDGMLLNGFVYADETWYAAGTVGSPQYIGDIAGRFQELETTTGYIRVIGHMAQSNILHFNPDNIWLGTSSSPRTK